MRWMLPLAFLALTSACLEPPALRPRDPTPGVPYITVTTFNVDLHRFDDEPTVLAVGETGADVLALQEVSEGWQAVIQARYMDRYPYMAFAGEASGGLAILSRHPFEDRGVIEGVDGWHPAWHIVVLGPTGPLQLLLVHLRPPYNARTGIDGVLTVDEDHLQEVRAFSEPCADGVPTIVLGDFNESLDGAGLTYLEEQGFRNVLPLFRPGQETWRYQAALYGQTVDTIDHILYDPSTLAPLNAWVRYDGNSDHLPVTAVFELTTAPGR
ncbi:MAG: endonuclease/exonuclease/phosphatase family protein [Myxococcales bacterium]|nr:endonuclease/exonuclease/phosphatase family protein [Myxococcales bacterium]MCB9549250.1 endonuclease/exonuclease/phosphatase family protein [Myxococcales bacterium]